MAAYFVTAFGTTACEYCGAKTHWLTYDEEDGDWIGACYPGIGCAAGSEDPHVDLSAMARDSGVSLRLVMSRVHSGIRQVDVILAKSRSLGGDETPRATIDGVTRPLAEWAKLYGIKYQTMRKRQLAGVAGRDLISKPKKRTAA